MANFGHELRRLLATQEISLREAARRVPCNSGHLSKLASGKKGPSPEIAQRLDDVLDAGGDLARLAPAGPSHAAELATPGQLVPWAFDFGQDVTSAATRRKFTATFLAAFGIAMSARRLAAISHVGAEHVQLLESVLGELERTDASEGGDRVCDGAAALLDTVYEWIYASSYGVATGSALGKERQYIQRQLVAQHLTEREVDRLDSLTVLDPGCGKGTVRVRVTVTLVQDDYLAADGHVDHSDEAVGSTFHLIESFVRSGTGW